MEPEAHEIPIRVRYAETDQMGLVHHAQYIVYFEQGRTELLRSKGRTYRQMEEAGFFLVITRVQCRYRKPARYDDLLTLRTILTRMTHYRLDHRYELLRGAELLADGESTLACVDRSFQLQPLPETIQGMKSL